MKDVIVTIKQPDGTEISVSTVMIDEDVLRYSCGLDPNEQE